MTVRLGLDGRCGLVTGGTSDIGSACVQRLCDEGMTIAFTGGDRGRGASIANQTGSSFLACDHRDRSSSDRAVEQAIDRLGRLDVLVTNADMRFEGSIQATSEDVFGDLLEMNLTSLFRSARACIEPMRASGGGSMIHIASAAGIRADHEAGAFSVISAGVLAVAELLAAEGVAHGIRANAVCPGGVREVAPPSGQPGTGTGPDVAATVAWLCSEDCAHMSGATLRLDGGAGAAMVLDTRG
ncbi:MAG: SDR family oxidoreductase [Actinomycetota bacterium]|nr:SDR family oxidoreductase [Actinomycetota bacterium]